MATVVLQTVGAAIGGALGGPFGAILGRAAGAAAGYAIDQTYLAKDQVIQGPRLENSRILSSSEGAPIPRVYGRNRISGQIVWATRFEEVASTEKRGGKGKSGISTREEDFVVQIFTANTHTPVLFFSTQGLAYKIKAHKIPEGTAASKGKSIFALKAALKLSLSVVSIELFITAKGCSPGA